MLRLLLATRIFRRFRLMAWWLTLSLYAQTTSPALRGKVLDARTGEPLEKVRVTLAGAVDAVVTGAGGTFRIAASPTGKLILQVSAPSYALLKYPVPPEKVDQELEIALQPDADSVKSSVTVAADVFEGLDGNGAASEHTLNKAELQALGTSVLGDPLRSVQALPSVTTTNDGRGEVSVRGSSYERVGLMVDGIFLDGFLHQISSDALGSDRDRASFSIVTPDRIAEVSLLNGAFPAREGLRTAGLVQLRTREGNREKRDFRISSGLTLGTAIVHDGPFARKRGSYLVGFRSSALNPLTGGGGDTRYRFDDGQLKLLYDLTSRHRFSLSVLLGQFRYDDRKTALMANRNTVTQANSASLALVLNWDWTLASRLLVNTKLFETQVGLNGLNREATLLGRLPRKQRGIRQDWTLDSGHGGRIQFGTYLRSIEGEANGYDFPNPLLPVRRETERFRGSTTEGNYYVQTTQTLPGQVTFHGGLRLERNSLTRETYVSPRLSLAWNPGEGRVTWRLGYGRHRQFADLNDLLSREGNPALKGERTDHYLAGANLRLSERSRVHFEVFERRDQDQVFRLDEPRLVSGRVIDAGARPQNSVSGRARGLEMMLQRRSGNRFSGWASYAYLTTRMKERSAGLVFPTDFDQRHTVSLFGNYRLSDSWSMNAIYRLSSGAPFPGFLRRDSDSRYFLAAVRNDLRLRAYGRLDLRVNKSIVWKATRWTFTVEGLNLLNQGNVTFNGIERYSGTTGQILNPVTLYGFTRTATAGVVLQF